jgi:hypothetical protein
MKRWQPPEEQVVAAPKPRRWPIAVLLFAIFAVGLAGVWMIWRNSRPQSLVETVAPATGVRSDVSLNGDSIDVAVTWLMEIPPGLGKPDSVRLEAGLGDGRDSRIRVTPSDNQTDTLRLPAPVPGETATGYSCVAAIYGSRLSRENCTPWQFVRPATPLPTAPAAPDTTAKRPKAAARSAGQPVVSRIVVQPSGQQVDPDIGGRCAEWQRRNPGRRIWIEVNREAVPECTGPNGKPTVAQFCAFAVLEDGRRVKTKNSTNVPYCEQLFRTWVQERVT